MATFVTYRNVCFYSELRKAIRDFENSTRAFQPAQKWTKKSPGALMHEQSERNVKLLVRHEARVQKMQSRIDSLTDQLSNFTLMMKKGHAEKQDYGQGPARTSSYCREPGHEVDRCLRNPNRDRRCANCGKMGHGPETCWSNVNAISAVKNDKKDPQDRFILLRNEYDSTSSENVSSEEDDAAENNVLHVIMEAKSGERDCVLTVKRGIDGQTVPKKPTFKSQRPYSCQKYFKSDAIGSKGGKEA